MQQRKTKEVVEGRILQREMPAIAGKDKFTKPGQALLQENISDYDLWSFKMKAMEWMLYPVGQLTRAHYIIMTDYDRM